MSTKKSPEKLNEGFPPPLRSETEDQTDEETSVVASFVFEEIFPHVVVVSPHDFRKVPPPIHLLMDQDDSDQKHIIERRRLAYLGSILRSWQRAVLEQQVFAFPRYQEVKEAKAKTTKNIIEYQHHGLEWRSSYFISASTKQMTLVVHLANDGYIYIPDSAMGTTQIGRPNNRHPKQPLGWAALKADRRDAVMEELKDFVAFTTSWFEGATHRKMVLYNASLRQVDICFQSRDPDENGTYTALEFSFERDWPVTDEKDWYW